MKPWNEEEMRKRFDAQEHIDGLIVALAMWGHIAYHESFDFAKLASDSYQRQTKQVFTPIQDYDFRRAFELGYKFAMALGEMKLREGTDGLQKA